MVPGVKLHELIDRRSLLGFALIALVRAAALVLFAAGLTQGVAAVAANTILPASSGLMASAGALLLGLTAWVQGVFGRNRARVVIERERAELVGALTGESSPLGTSRDAGMALTATRQLDKVEGFYLQFVPALAQTAVIPLVLGLVVLSQDWLSALLVLLTLPLIPIFMVLIGQHTVENTKKSTEALLRMSQHFAELARGLPALVGLGRSRAGHDSLISISREYRRATVKNLRVAFLSALALELVATLSVALVAVVIGVRMVKGDLGLEVGLLVLILAPDIYNPLREVGSSYHAAQDGLEALAQSRAQRARAVNTVTSTGDTDSGHAADDTAPANPQWDAATARLQELTEDPDSVPFLALSGPSGAGKSTVLGRWLEANYRDRNILWVQQLPLFTEPTVRAELGQAPDAAINAALERFGLQDLAERHPSWLSPGEQRRLALARAEVQRTRDSLVVLDEPTAHLDGARRADVIQWLHELRGATPVLVASHDRDVKDLADTTIALTPRETPSTIAESPNGDPALQFSLPEPIKTKPAAVIEAPGADAPDSDATSADDAERTRTGWGAVLDLTRGARWRLLAAVLTGALASMAAIALSALSGWLIVRASEQPPILFLLVAIVGVRFFGLARALLRYLERLVSHDVVFDLQGKWRAAVWKYLSERALSLKERLTPAASVNALVVKVDELRDALIRAVVPVAGLPIVLVAAAAVTAIFAPSLLWIQLLGVAVSVLAGVGFSLITEARARRLQRGLRADLVSATLDTLSQRDYLRVHRTLGHKLEHLRELDRQAVPAENALAGSTGLAAALITAVQALTAALMIPIGASTAVAAPLLLTIVLMQIALTEPIMNAQSAAGWWFPVLALAKDIPHGEHANPGHPATEAINAVELHQVSARWGEDLPLAVESVSAGVRRGEWLSITGPSGSGKTTLLAIMLGFLRPESGSVAVNDAPRMLAPGELAPRVAWCPQEGHIFDSTIRGNLALSRAGEVGEEQMWAALKTAGLAHMVASRAGGLDAKVGPAGSWLSGGERQRLAIARAVLAGADIVCLDEPSAHLDEPTARELQDQLRTHLSGHGVVQVTHQDSDVRAADTRLDLGTVTHS